ncbi:MAG: fibronectin type III domain-containing protein [Clostridia bacterium]|nr:fibronectin type III domain-containing protein [Clostridia bacterium]
MKKFIALLLCLVTIGGTCAFSAAADDFSSVLACFPDSYKASLTALHKAHPNWVFKRVSVGRNFATCLNAEHNCRQQLCTLEASSASDPRVCPSSCKDKAYHLIADGTRCASYDYIAECMDPTNYLRDNFIFQFEYQNAKSYYTQAMLEKALDNSYSFMYKKTCKVGGKTYYYSQIILEACKANNVDALFIISRITNEVGALYPVKLARGYAYNGKTVYNFFSVGAYPTYSNGKLITAPENGAKYAYSKGWTNPKAALEGGIKFIAQNYTKAGQYTNYFQKYQVNPKCEYDFYQHQYMQGVEAIINESGYTYKNYVKLGILEKAHVFYLPVYENLSKVNYEAQDLKFKSATDSTNYYYVNAQVASELALRSGAGTGYTKLAGLTRGALVQYLGRSGLWYKVKVLNSGNKGKTGYVHSDYLNAAQKLFVQKGAKATLKPKVRTSTCSYALAAETVSGAATISGGIAYGKKIGSSVFRAKSSAGRVGYIEIACTGVIAAPVCTATGGNKKVTISWKAISDAQSYRVYSYNTSTKKYTRLTQTTATSYTAGGLANSTKYTFLVRAVDIYGGASAYTTKNHVTALTLPGKPAVKIEATTNAVTLKWAAVKGAVKYGIWQYNSAKDNYTKLANTDKLSYTISGLKANSKYIYLVRSYNATGWSAFTRADNVSIVTAPTAPQVTATGGEKAIRLRWNSCTGAAFYRVYAYNTATKKYTRLAQTTALTYKITDLAEGTQYMYLVRAFRSAASGSTYSEKNHVSAYTIPTKPTVSTKAGSTAVTLSWKAVKSAVHYGVWLYDAQSNSYQKLANTTALTYEVGDLEPGTQYRFLVRAHNDTGWNKYTAKDTVAVTTLG